ncbi:MAG: hypothetical protein RR945_02080 [Erysipelotrichaceae bacterium]
MKCVEGLIFENGLSIKVGDFIQVKYDDGECTGRFKEIERDHTGKCSHISLDISAQYVAKERSIKLDIIKEVKIIYNPGILYLCDGNQCESCEGGLCRHSSNIKVAKNFEFKEGAYIEIESNNDIDGQKNEHNITNITINTSAELKELIKNKLQVSK